MAQYGNYYPSSQPPTSYAYPSAPDASPSPTYYSQQQPTNYANNYNPHDYSQSHIGEYNQQASQMPHAGQNFPTSQLGYENIPSNPNYPRAINNFPDGQVYDYGYAQQVVSPASAPPTSYVGADYGSGYGQVAGVGDVSSNYGYSAQQHNSQWVPQHDSYSRYEQAPLPLSTSGLGYDPYADQIYDTGSSRNGKRYEDDQKFANIYADQKYTVSSKKSESRERKNVGGTHQSGANGIEKFHVTLVPSDNDEPESVVLQVGLEGVEVMETGLSGKPVRVYPLDQIQRWSLQDPQVLTFWHCPREGGQTDTVRVMAPDKVVRSLRDTLTCSCLQLGELRGLLHQEGEGSHSGSASDHVNALASARATQHTQQHSRHSAVSEAEDETEDKDVEFWNGAEREGWLMKQGEVIKTWRRRWFILKQGRLFWFKEHRVTPQSKSRGIVRLCEVKEVKATEDPKFQPCTFQLKMKDDSIQYFTADTETEQAGWISEIESKCLALGSIPKGNQASGREEGLRTQCTHAQLAEQLKMNLERMSMNNRR